MDLLLKNKSTIIAGFIFNLLCLNAVNSQNTQEVTGADDINESELNEFDNSYRYSYKTLMNGFKNPPIEAHPGVYWYFMDGNMSKDEMTDDLESMKEAGISHVIFLEVNVGIPREEIEFLSDEWLDHFKHLENEARRLDIGITLGIGPGWAGSGGPWVKAKNSMRHLIASQINIQGGKPVRIPLDLPEPHAPFFGEGALTDELRKRWMAYYEDVAVLAFPEQEYSDQINLLDEKSIVYRSPYSSDKTTKTFLPAPSTDLSNGVNPDSIINITDKLSENGILEWDVPAGKWTVLRFVSRNNGAVTRPAPVPGLGFESDKFDSTAFKMHMDDYFSKIFDRIKPLNNSGKGGLKVLHQDSWEMGAQNWTDRFRSEFMKRRGYDPMPYFPVYHGIVVGSKEKSERFLWDIRQTSQDLIIDQHIRQIKRIAEDYRLKFSMQPYDMNPASNLALGSTADFPMGEFWTDSHNTSYSVIEATSIANVKGINVVKGEAFTSGPDEKLQAHPASLKNQGDWAFAQGINQFYYHTFAHKPLGDSLRPGMTMGPYGVHWDRGQTWWPLVKDYHSYIARTSYMLQQGTSVSDILYLTPEGVPHIFIPPPSATTGLDFLPDKRGYQFDGVDPGNLINNAKVEDGKVVFPGGASYQILILPIIDLMTPELLHKIEELLMNGAKIAGPPPKRSPSLTNYPKADQIIQEKAKSIWREKNSEALIKNSYGRGEIYYGGELNEKDGESLYPTYVVKNILVKNGFTEDLRSVTKLRFNHKRFDNMDIYFVSNPGPSKITTHVEFRTSGKSPQLWNPRNGTLQGVTEFISNDHTTGIELSFEPYESYFLVFSMGEMGKNEELGEKYLKPVREVELHGAWDVFFDTKWGGPEKVVFDSLSDWKDHENEGIKYYSGIATYKMSLDSLENLYIHDNEEIYLSLGEVNVIANVKVNGQNAGTVWSYPWRANITNLIRTENNQIEIQVSNQWNNRLIGDEQYPYDGIVGHTWPDWFLNKEKRPSDRYTFITYPFFDKDSELKSSGLLGPVRLIVKRKIK